MKTGILITARLGSIRLKKKHLLDVNGQPILMFLIKRILGEFNREISLGEVKLIIATSDEPENKEFEQFINEGVCIFYGSPENIPLRHLQAAKVYYLDNIVSVDGDDILCSVKGMRRVYELLSGGDEYVKTTNLPFGMNSWGYSVSFLETSLKSHFDEVLETGWGRIFDTKEPVNIEMQFRIKSDLLRFTLDYQEDYKFFKSLIEEMGDSIYSASDDAIANNVLVGKLYKINEVTTRDYWNNFYVKVEEEKQSLKKN